MKLNNIDLNKIPIFLAIVRLGNLSFASEELNLTKSALSQSLSTLEAQLGKVLFLRIKNRLVLTDEGRSFYNDLVNYETYVQTALDRLQNNEPGLEGELTVGCYFEFAKFYLTPTVKRFLKNAKNAQVRFRFESPSKLDSLLAEGKIDLTISIYPYQGGKSIRSFKLLREELVLIGHGNAFPSQVNFENLASLPIIDYYSDHQLITRWVRNQFGQRRFKPNVKVFAASAEMVAELVRAQVGIGVVPNYVAESLLQNDCQIINEGGPKLYDYIWVNEHHQKNEKKNILKQEFLKALALQFQNNKM